MKRKLARRMRNMTLVITAAMIASPVGCLNSTWFKRFRDAWAPGAVEGFSSAVTDPTNAETGLRQALTALFEGIGAIVQTTDAK